MPTPRGAAKPGLFAPKGEKELYAALYEGLYRYDLFDRIASEYPEYAVVADTLAGVMDKSPERKCQLLARVFESGRDPLLEPFLQKYGPNLSITVPISVGVEALLPLNRDAVGLLLAELDQLAGDLPAAIDIVEQLEPSSYAAVSLAELYCFTDQHEEVVKLTDGVKNEDDCTALLLVFRAVSLREQGMSDAALETFKEALRARSRTAVIRHLALFERSGTYSALNKKALARKDLERIIAADSNFPMVREALEELSS